MRDDRLLVRVVAAGVCLVGGLALLGNAVLQVSAGPDAPSSTRTTAAAPAPALTLPPPVDAALPPSATATASRAVPAPSSTALPLAGRTVVVDPGHNRDNARASDRTGRQVEVGGTTAVCDTAGTRTASGFAESAFTWRTARALQRRLEALGAEVVLTRRADAGIGPCVDQRGLSAGRVEAAVLVSLHAEGGATGGPGFHVVSPGLVGGRTEQTVTPSARLALRVRDAMVARGLRPSTSAGREGLDVRKDLGELTLAGVPAVLVDCGDLRDPGVGRRLATGGAQEQNAASVADGVVAFLR